MDLGEKTRKKAVKRKTRTQFQATGRRFSSQWQVQATLTNGWSGFFHACRIKSPAR
jgi:hypothetical protein